METLRPILNALGYATPERQRAYVQLLGATGCMGEPVTISNALADKLLDTPAFNDAEHALTQLHAVTQAHWLRPKDTMRYQIAGRPEWDIAQPYLSALGHNAATLPQEKIYDHVLVLGAMENTTKTRLATLGVSEITPGHIYLLGCQRPLVEGHEPSAGKLTGAVGGDTESGMFLAAYQAIKPHLPPALQQAPVTLIDTPNHNDGKSATTQDTVRSWLATNPKPGRVLVISNQPHMAYQHAAVRSVLPDVFKVETIGSANTEVKPTVVLDNMARELDVSLPRIRAELKHRNMNQALEQVHMIPLESIDINPEVFQFRSGTDAKGETKKHHIQHEYNPLAMAPLLLYARQNGVMEVVDGHHRLASACAAKERGVGPKNIPARILFEYEGITPVEARVIGAYVNFAQEFKPGKIHAQSELIDAARVFHLQHHGQVRKEILPRIVVEGELADACQAGKLTVPAFAYVQRGEVPVEMAAEVAAKTTKPDTQVAVMSLISSQLQQGRAFSA